MTKVSFIAGFPGQSKGKRYQSRKVARPKPLEYTTLSEGEFRLSLYRDRMKLLEEFYPDQPEYRAYREAFDQGLNVGIHSEGANLSGIGYVPALEIIRQVKRLDQPAVKLSGNWWGLGSVENECREEKEAFAKAQSAYMRSALWNKNKRRKEMEAALLKLNDCTGLLEVQRVLNQHLENSSHHLLYHFVSNPNASPAVVATKHVNHRVAVGNFAKTAGLSQTNMVEWLTNGIMRNNAKKGTEPFDPAQTIEIMRTEISEQGAGVNGAFLAALPLIIKAITAAAGATALLISQLKAQKQQQLQANLQGLGTGVFGPEGGDWYTGSQDNPGYTEEDNGAIDYLPFLIGGAALLLLSK